MLRKSFTILELLIVVIIIGVLGTLGFVNYGSIRETSITKEARANLKLIAAAERIYRMEVGYFYPRFPGGQAATAAINADLRLSLSTANQRWDYTVGTNSFDDFTATSTRSDGSGCAWTMNQADSEAQPPVAGCPQ